ncbi:hypothetical protein GIB67_001171 [Kingdonia uniflora]|uniref:Uncharacterized protein n=1 Tax=Kingdonia uniflora TaxID=39325 RepID=A0A7J7LGF9_9MAGN|nr:hypothetical protein GIB67_001171 [Kingdonia uniflora]
MSKHPITSSYRKYSDVYQQFEYMQTLLEIESSSTVWRYQSVLKLCTAEDTPPLINRSYICEHHKRSYLLQRSTSIKTLQKIIMKTHQNLIL